MGKTQLCLKLNSSPRIGLAQQYRLLCMKGFAESEAGLVFASLPGTLQEICIFICISLLCFKDWQLRTFRLCFFFPTITSIFPMQYNKNQDKKAKKKAFDKMKWRGAHYWLHCLELAVPKWNVDRAKPIIDRGCTDYTRFSMEGKDFSSYITSFITRMLPE